MEIFDIIKNLNFSNIMWQILTPLIFSLADIITGYIQAIINKNLDSQKMRTGLLHKVLIVIIIILSFIIQYAFSIKYISSVVCIYVVIMEIISILENLKKAGIEIGKIGDILKEKAEDNTVENVNKLINTIDNKINEEFGGNENE